MIFPNRVWEPTGRKTDDGKRMWASREPDANDKAERVKLAVRYARRQCEREQAEKVAA